MPWLNDRRLPHPEARLDVVERPLRRRGCERQHGRTADGLDGPPQAEIGRAEVVAPLRDAVRFVNHDEVDFRAPEQRLKGLVGHPLGGREQELEALVGDVLGHLLLLAGSARAVELRHVQTQAPELVDLILRSGR